MTAFKPAIWPEEPAPPYAVNCQNCELAGHRGRVIWGEGNPEAPLFVLLDNPGARENKEGAPFVCGTRETLQQGLHEVGVEPDAVYVSYLLKCRPLRAYDKPLAREACAPYWKLQLADKHPDLLLGLGNVVAQALVPGEDAEVKRLRGSWHQAAGLPTTFTYHPLAVRRRPVLMKYFLEDLAMVARELKERGKATKRRQDSSE
ncbi:uracil-DNA glycosylase [Xylanibacillus composti]|uniref:Uracil-DNA glycosylase n=1 Tax=Xylanibacillus composti TaxID=1572762 RepID=A0A8J4H6I3_9BACL|nr:uracil-DNA glycosylase [Xylanibacillus composti]MDT9726346.1 uracil-DNA glycosylase [Xylanibacillus composti]GIQ70546.1 uracil-DNA glycosylase [Xylanibacillus composti]